MSIIAEALKRAEKEKSQTLSSKEHLNKILGPERKQVYRGQEGPAKATGSSSSAGESQESQGLVETIKKSKTLNTTGRLLLVAIAFLAVVNLLTLYSPGLDFMTSGKSADVAIEAEAYTNLSSEVSVIEERAGLMDRMMRALTPGPATDLFLPELKLDGIVWDMDDPWAVINNRVVKAGDVVEGAKVVSIEKQRVVMLFRDEVFDLRVK